MTRRLLLGTLPLLVLLFSPSAHAWGCKGHQTVALIAERHLTPEARQFLEKLLADNPVDAQLKRNCGNARDPFADASTWPDDVRNERKNGPWHYIDIPRGAAHTESIDEYCGPQGCVTKAIADQLAVLKDKSANPRNRADAVRYLVHFVGDLHMPLHATTNNDMGGGCVPVRFFRRRPREHNHSFTPNLHSIWDTAIVERDMEGAEPAEYADFLENLFAADFDRWQKAGIQVGEWAWESHGLAEHFVYGQLAPPVPLEKAVPVESCTDDNKVGERMLEVHFFAGENYQDAAAPIVEERIAQAGLRLAMILNEAVLAPQRKN